MSKYEDISGQTFGKLTVVCDVGRNSTGAVYWDCVCECGNHVKALTSTLRRQNKSCGRCPVSPVEASVADIAWAAGLFDGEGCVSLHFGKRSGNKNPCLYLSVTVSNTFLPALERLADIFGFGYIYTSKQLRPKTRKIGHVYVLGARQAECFLMSVMPHLTIKRRQAEIAIEFRRLRQDRPFQKLSRDGYWKAVELADAMRACNGNHHAKFRERFHEIYAPAS